MCWQCAGVYPYEWLSIFDSFHSVGWWFGPGCGDGIFEFQLEGETYHTNPHCIVEWMMDHIPGEVDHNGVPWFINGPYLPGRGDKFYSNRS